MKRLPRGWTWASIADLSSDMRNGLSPKPDANDGLPVLRISAVRSMRVDLADRRFFDPAPAGWERYSLKSGDLLFTRYSGTPAFVGVCGVVRNLNEPLVYPDKLIRVRLHPEIVLPSFIEQCLVVGQPRAEIESRLKTTSGQVGISGSDLSKVSVPVAPLNEQRRIVAKIDALTAKSRRAKEALDAIPPLLDKLRQSILAAAFRGDLTADWRAAHPDVEPASKFLDRIRTERRRRWEEAELAKMKAKGKPPADDRWKAKYQEPEPVDESGLPELPEGWCWASIGQLASDLPRSIQSGPFGSNLRHEEFRSEGILAIGIDNVRDGSFSLGANHRISEQKYQELKKYAVRAGDFLITVMATVGRCCVVPDHIEDAIVTKHVYRVTVEQRLVDPELLVRAYQGAPTLLTALEASVRGQTRAGINGEILRGLAIPIPPISEQKELLRSVRHAFRLLANVEQQRSHLDSGIHNLDAAVLTKAFRGELVPQDPNDEPASVLLERIRTESGVQPKQNGRRRKAKTA